MFVVEFFIKLKANSHTNYSKTSCDKVIVTIFINKQTNRVWLTDYNKLFEICFKCNEKLDAHTKTHLNYEVVLLANI